MKSTTSTRRRMPGPAAGVWLIALALLVATVAPAQNRNKTDNKKKKQEIPYNEDPNVPNISRAERIRRQEAYIRRKVKEGREARTSAAVKRLQEKLKQGGIGSLTSKDLAELKNINPTAAGKKSIEMAVKKPKNGPEGEMTDEEKKAAEYVYMTFYFEPASVVVHPGDVFRTSARLLNVDRLQMDRFELAIRYSPEVVEPISIHQDAIEDLIVGSPQWGIDREQGLIFYSARFAEPRRSIDMRMIDVAWRALKPVDNLELELVAGGRESAAYDGEELVTENVFGTAGPLVGANIRIVPQDEKLPPGDRMVTVRSRDFAPALIAAGSNNARAPSLGVAYDRQEVYEPGQWIVFDFYIENPDGAVFDELRLLLQYDPEEIEFADADRGNWLRRGINVLDGPFRDRWYWDAHLVNEIRPNEGIIEYWVGCSQICAQPQGVVARAFGRIKRLAADPLIHWVWNDSDAVDALPATNISILGKNILGGIDGVELRTPGAPPEKAKPSDYRF